LLAVKIPIRNEAGSAGESRKYLFLWGDCPRNFKNNRREEEKSLTVKSDENMIEIILLIFCHFPT
jgi:hypothetical protein